VVEVVVHPLLVLLVLLVLLAVRVVHLLSQALL
jgi:hypothetical protein